jgi:hypothetical protein
MAASAGENRRKVSVLTVAGGVTRPTPDRESGAEK